MKSNEVYTQYPEIIAFFSVKDGKICFDFNDNKISFEEMMIINSNLVTEYLKTVAISVQQQKNPEEKGN